MPTVMMNEFIKYAKIGLKESKSKNISYVKNEFHYFYVSINSIAWNWDCR